MGESDARPAAWLLDRRIVEDVLYIDTHVLADACACAAQLAQPPTD